MFFEKKQSVTAECLESLPFRVEFAVMLSTHHQSPDRHESSPVPQVERESGMDDGSMAIEAQCHTVSEQQCVLWVDSLGPAMVRFQSFGTRAQLAGVVVPETYQL